MRLRIIVQILLNNVKGTTTKETKKILLIKWILQNIVGNSSKTTTIQETKKSEDSKNINEKGKNEVQNGTKELSFAKPVDGDIVKEFAKDNLLFSQTLQEWTVHTGVDIKAEKTTVVKASEAGTVKSIKNDPRYGLTIVILHDNGFETVYSNLLTSEFVVEGEKSWKRAEHRYSWKYSCLWGCRWFTFTFWNIKRFNSSRSKYLFEIIYEYFRKESEF